MGWLYHQTSSAADAGSRRSFEWLFSATADERIVLSMKEVLIELRF
jgi:hypothetical protein